MPLQAAGSHILIFILCLSSPQTPATPYEAVNQLGKQKMLHLCMSQNSFSERLMVVQLWWPLLLFFESKWRSLRLGILSPWRQKGLLHPVTARLDTLALRLLTKTLKVAAKAKSKWFPTMHPVEMQWPRSFGSFSNLEFVTNMEESSLAPSWCNSHLEAAISIAESKVAQSRPRKDDFQGHRSSRCSLIPLRGMG